MVARAQERLSFAEDFLLGGLAASLSKSLSHPAERMKLLQQAHPDWSLQQAAKEMMAHPTAGLGASIIRYFPTQALNFAFKDSLKNNALFKPSRTDGPFLKFLRPLLSGGAAGALSLLFVYPLDMIQTHQAVGASTGGIAGAAVGLYREGGLTRFYSGFVVSTVGIVFYRGAYFGLYDSLKDVVKPRSDITRFLFAMSVTILAGLCSYPVDSLRRHQMLTGDSILGAASSILKKNGPAGFFAGAGLNVARGLAGALVLMGFDGFKRIYVDFRTKSKRR